MKSIIFANLPALVVVVPLLGALLTLVVGRRFAWSWVMLNAAVVFVLTCLLVWRVHDPSEACAFAGLPEPAPGPLSYVMGRWPAFWGIEYRVDHLNAMVLLIIASVGLVTTFYGRLSLASEVAADRIHIFYAIWLLCLMGMMGMTITGDAFNVYVLLEISALTIYVLIAMGKGRDRRALVASMRYQILGTIGATFILLGIGYLFMVTGTLNMAAMHQGLLDLHAEGKLLGNRTVQVAIAFLMLGMAVKMALFPLHMWLPTAYAFAPSAVSAMLAATATKVGVYVGIRFLFTVFGAGVGPDLLFVDLSILMFFALSGVIVASVAAIRQNDAKLLLAYSSVAQIGYMVLGFTLNNRPGITGSVVHLFNHALIKGGMFLALGCVIYRLGGAEMRHLRGLGRRMPWTMAALTTGGFGLIGVPLTAGFISKWYLIEGCLVNGWWPVAGVVLIGSLLAVVYVWKMVEVIWFQEPEDHGIDVREAPVSMVLATWILIGGSIWFGIDATLPTALATEAAFELLPDWEPR